MSSIQELVRQATQIAMTTLGSERHNVVFRFLKSKSDTVGLRFRPIESTTDQQIEDKNGGKVHTHETVFYIDGPTMRDFRAYCGNFARARVVRIVNNRREIFKLLKEKPFDELIENDVFFRLNAVKIKEEPT